MLRQLIYIIFSYFLFPVIVNAQYVPDFRVNDDTGNAYQSFASVDVDSEGNFIIVWLDERDSTGFPFHRKIYCQRFDKYGQKIGSNFLIPITPGRTPTSPSITIKYDGSFVLAWFEGNNNSSACKLQLFNKEAKPVSELINVNDSVVVWYLSQRGIKIGIDNSNNIIVAFYYKMGVPDTYNVYIQRFDSLGRKIGTNEKVNDNKNSSNQELPSINKKIDYGFIISWRDRRNFIPDIFMQLYDSTGQKIGMNKKVTDDNIPNSHRGSPSVSSDSLGRFIIAWTDSRLTFGDYDNIFAQIYDLGGNEIGSNFRVDLGPASAWNRRSPRVATRRNGNTVIAWYDQIGGPTMRKLSPEGSFIGGEYFISYQGVGNSKILNDIAIWKDRIITVWQDNRNGDYDIYCNIRSYQNPDSVISNIHQIGNEIPGRFNLYQNYPNPFNSSTKIKFEIPYVEISNVKLKVYNSLGQEVVLLINGLLSPGIYEYHWDANGIPSGVYYYTLQAGNFRHTKRLVLIK